MKDLSKATTEELRAELDRREEMERKERWAAICAAFPCPECGADPTHIGDEAVEEIRRAPRDDEGRPMLFAPYEMGTTEGIRYVATVTCANGHEWQKEEIKWFETE